MFLFQSLSFTFCSRTKFWLFFNLLTVVFLLPLTNLILWGKVFQKQIFKLLPWCFFFVIIPGFIFFSISGECTLFFHTYFTCLFIKYIPSNIHYVWSHILNSNFHEHSEDFVSFQLLCCHYVKEEEIEYSLTDKWYITHYLYACAYKVFMLW